MDLTTTVLQPSTLEALGPEDLFNLVYDFNEVAKVLNHTTTEALLREMVGQESLIVVAVQTIFDSKLTTVGYGLASCVSVFGQLKVKIEGVGALLIEPYTAIILAGFEALFAEVVRRNNTGAAARVSLTVPQANAMMRRQMALLGLEKRSNVYFEKFA